MKYRGTTVVWLVAVMLVVGLATTASAANLSLVSSKSAVIPGETFTVDIVLDDLDGKVAACALTLTYPTDKVDAPAGDSEGAVQGITSVFFQNFQSTRMHRENVDSAAGKILFSGANIGNDGGPPYSSSDQMILFTIPFTVKNDPGLIGQSITFGLEQSQLLNTDAGWGDGVNPEPVPVLVGALPNTHQDWGDLTKAFPVLLSDTTDPPFTPLTSAAITILEFPTYVTSGTITYTGQQTGTLHVAAFETTDTTFSNPIGGETYPWPQGTSSVDFALSIKDGTYYLAAFIDANGDSNLAAWEAQGNYLTAIIISGDHDTTSRDFSLYDPDDNANGLPDWWDNQYPGIGGSADDFDQDGYTNLVELQNMTNPTVQDDAYVYAGYDPSTDNRGPYQVVTITPSALHVTPGGNFTLNINYNVTNGNNLLSGLDISIHFDSSKIDYEDYANFLNVGDITSAPNVLPDTQDEDNDPNTDTRIQMSWTSFSGNWPNVNLPSVLAELNFTLKESATEGETLINVSVFDNAANYSFAGVGSTITAQEWNLDIDGNGEAKPLTDGLLIMRYLLRFHLAGDTWIDGVVAGDATRTTAAEIEAYCENAIVSLISDIDGNGEAKPLTDGLLIMRYLLRFHLAGDTWIDGVVAGDATRTTAAEIEAYISSIMVSP